MLQSVYGNTDALNQRRRTGEDFEEYFQEVSAVLPALFHEHSVPPEFMFEKNHTPWGMTCTFSVNPVLAKKFGFKILKVSSDCPHLVYPIIGQMLGDRGKPGEKHPDQVHEEIRKILATETFYFFRSRFPGFPADVHCFSIPPARSKELGLSLYHLQWRCPEAALKILKNNLRIKSC